jgi:hypothetical protein
MRFIPALLVVLAVGGLAQGTSAQTPKHPDFSGTWVLKNQVAGVTAKSYVMLIVHKEPEIRVERTIDGTKDGITLRTDGKATTEKLACCGDTTTTATWDGSAIRRRSTYGTSVIDDTWTLGSDGLEFTIVRRVSQGTSVTNLTYIFGKKQ